MNSETFTKVRHSAAGLPDAKCVMLLHEILGFVSTDTGKGRYAELRDFIAKELERMSGVNLIVTVNTGTYEELRTQLGQLPMTWYPDLIRAMVEAAHRQNVFRKGGASLFVANVEAKIERRESEKIRA